MIWVHCITTILLAICHLSSSIEHEDHSSKLQPDSANPSNRVEPQGPRRKRHDSYASDIPKHKQKMWRFELDVPEVLDAVKRYTGVTITNPKGSGDLRATDEGILGQKIRFEVKPPNLAALMGYVSDLMNAQSARRYSYVEEGPGTIKSDHVDYPPRFHEGRLKLLMMIKEKMKGKS